MKNLAFLLQCLAVFLLAGCMDASVEPTETSVEPTEKPLEPTKTSVEPTGTPDVRIKTTNINGGGWDDFPNKYKPTLLDLNANVRQLPAPVGTRYASLYPINPTGAKVAAAAAPCSGDSAVLQYKSPMRDFFLYDTISYYDTNGVAHCWPQEGRRSVETHQRHIVEFGVGEVWESIQDSITDQDVLPRHTIRGTGLIRLESGRELIIQSYDLILLTQFGTQDAFVVNAGLKLLYKDGYTINLDLAKPRPYGALDFYPADGPADYSLIMTGPITHATAQGGVDTVGFIDLYGDRTIRVRDWTGVPVVP